MRAELELYELIDRYLDHTLNAEELAAFEARLASNTELLSMVEVSAMTRELVVESGLNKERALLKNLESSHQSGKSKLYTSIGIGVGILALLLTVFFIREKTETKQRTQYTSDNSKVEVLVNQSETSSTPVLKKIDKEKIAENTTASELQETATEMPTASLEPAVQNESNGLESDAKTNRILPETEIETVTEAEHVSCETQLREVKLYTIPSCENKSNGAIQIRGLKSNWKLFLNEEYAESTSNLAPGRYEVTIKTESGCQQLYTAEVKSKSCYENKQVNWSFSDPDNWNIESTRANGVISIMDRTGRIVVQEEINATYNANPDKFTDTGLYSYKITYPNGEFTQGFIQIVR